MIAAIKPNTHAYTANKVPVIIPTTHTRRQITIIIQVIRNALTLLSLSLCYVDNPME